MNSRSFKIVGFAAALVIIIGFLGIGIVYSAARIVRPVLAAQVEEPVNPELGLIILGVDPDGPSADTGIVRGDILQIIDDQEINRMDELVEYLETLEPDRRVTLTILHGDELRTYRVTPNEDQVYSPLGLRLCCGQGERFDLGILPFHNPFRQGGVVIVEVVAESPAERAGLEVGDRILGLDEATLDPEKDLASIIGALEPGDEVTLTIDRPAEGQLEITVTLGGHPADAEKAYLGIRYHVVSTRFQREGVIPFEDLPPLDELPFLEPPFGDGRRIAPGEKISRGVIILEVTESSPAEESGLLTGDLITAFNGEIVESPRQLVDFIQSNQPGDEITLTVHRDDEADPLVISVILGEEDGETYLGVRIGAHFRIRGALEEGDLQPFRDFFRFRIPGGEFDFDFDFLRPSDDET